MDDLMLGTGFLRGLSITTIKPAHNTQNDVIEKQNHQIVGFSLFLYQFQLSMCRYNLLYLCIESSESNSALHQFAKLIVIAFAKASFVL